jgi:phosphoglucomutase
MMSPSRGTKPMTVLVGGDGRIFNRFAIDMFIRMSVANGVCIS